MGSSKSGSLDKFASFSPAAALASGKVKLPETSLIGMMQADAEDNKVMKENNLANQMAYQNQQDEQQKYMQMMQQQMVPGMNMGGQVDSMKFLKQHLPYQDGGHVALRRKMFKMGGDVNTHGVGITSGLSYNQGGRVGMFDGGDVAAALDKLRSKGASAGETLSKTKIKGRKSAVQKGLGMLLSSLFGPAGKAIGRSAGRRSMKPIKAFLRQNPRSGAALLGLSSVAGPSGIVSAASNLAPDFDRFGDPDDENMFYRSPIAQGIRMGRESLVDPLVSISPLGGLTYGVTGETAGSLLRDAAGKESRTLELPEGSGENIGVDPGAFGKAAMQSQKEANEELIQEYMSLMSGEKEEPDTMLGKFFAAEGLGDALVAGGSALMEGEGYGAAARAFNEPLSAARRGETAEERANRAAAANLVLSENMQIAAEDRALANELLGAGDMDTAEQAELYKLARRAGVTQLVPTEEGDDTEIDADKLLSRAGVYADPKGLNPQGTLLVAVNSEGGVEYTNDPQAAKEYAAS